MSPLRPVPDRAPVRLPNSILSRLNDAASRHRIEAAEIVRRALRKYHRATSPGVVTLPNRIETTRSNSQVVKFSGVTQYSYLPLLGQIITWYLDNNDDGSSAPAPDIEEVRRLNGLDSSHTIIEDAQ